MRIFASLARIENVIVLSSLSLISFIARALMDWRYVYPFFMEITVESATTGIILYLIIAGAWVWAMINLSRSTRRATLILLLLNLMQFLLLGIFSSLILCPSPCPNIWPVGEIIIWSGTVTGFFGLLSLILFWRQRRKIYAS